ncbi:hypothetical protein [uncultured Pontibacter sp.]|uniref:hypothetical protein n=1 Tax=uncultured Pontibacter sp. TaxID=453356 RepID=UPI00263087C0|nr:hypothetical protein [uncultured Pontibacter sp.]
MKYQNLNNRTRIRIILALLLLLVLMISFNIGSGFFTGLAGGLLLSALVAELVIYYNRSTH